MALTQKFQLFAEEEAQPGVFSSDLFVAANADFEPINPSAEIAVDDVERDVVRGTLTKATAISGMREATIRFGIEMAGESSLSPSTAPKFGLLLRACGFHQVAHKALRIDTDMDGPFLHGETITGGTSTETATVVHDHAQGQTIVRIANATGNFSAGETITGSVSGTTATVDSPPGNTAAGSTWWPVSSNTATMNIASTSGDCAVGDLFQGATSRAIVRAKAAHFTAGSPATATAAEFEVLDGIVVDGETFSNITTGQTGSFTYSAGTVAYQDWPSVSLGLIEDGRAKSFRACRGTFSIDAQVGQPIVINFEFRGIYQGTEDRSPVTGVTRTNRLPVVFRGANVQVGTLSDTLALETQPRLSQFSLDVGNSLAFRKDANDTEGHNEVMITERSSTISIDPELQPEAAFAFLASLLDGTPFRVRFRNGANAGDRFIITAPGVKVTGANVGDRDGLATSDVQARLSGYAANGVDREDNELVLSYETVVAGW